MAINIPENTNKNLSNKKQTMRKFLVYILVTAGTLVFLISAIIAGLLIKIYFDFPANTNGSEDFEKASGVKIKDKVAYVQYTGWEDTQTYFRFTATQYEIDCILKSKRLTPANTFSITSSFYWWTPEKNKNGKCFENKNGSEWIWLYYNPESKEAYYFSTTF